MIKDIFAENCHSILNKMVISPKFHLNIGNITPVLQREQSHCKKITDP